ncbi:helix-turn-helix domain-containing protein [Leisingera sp. HS039]|uniref:helix-turn-helix domain-containing protein n=1 Tax=unclassified Leisingera TaxID=2614906 RepID=UPI001071209C|nr:MULTISPECIES: helix-turn-helix domain-containing protein [unclassified Leisingera]MBQ4823960.1 helix-turn-helix domain-containing protein [Leisingera sp. HS039]QBR38246.1 helix-turn-helix domain-containing protein [Leisingera sp. NJS201]
MPECSEKVVSIGSQRKKNAEDERTLSRKWGKATIDLGYTVIPSALLRGQARLGIGPNELAVLLHLLDHWWRPDEMPWPSKKTIAERLGVSTKTVQRAIVGLEQASLLRRNERYHKTGGRTSNEYDLRPLVERLKPIVADMAKAEKDSKATKRAAERPGLRKRQSAS